MTSIYKPPLRESLKELEKLINFLKESGANSIIVKDEGFLYCPPIYITKDEIVSAYHCIDKILTFLNLGNLQTGKIVSEPKMSSANEEK